MPMHALQGFEMSKNTKIKKSLSETRQAKSKPRRKSALSKQKQSMAAQRSDVRQKCQRENTPARLISCLYINVPLASVHMLIFNSSKQMAENSLAPRHKDLHQTQQPAPQISYPPNGRVRASAIGRQPKVKQKRRFPVANLDLSQNWIARKASQKSNESKSDSRELAAVKKCQDQQKHKFIVSSSRL